MKVSFKMSCLIASSSVVPDASFSTSQVTYDTATSTILTLYTEIERENKGQSAMAQATKKSIEGIENHIDKRMEDMDK